MEIVYKNVNDLIPYVNNTRTHSEEQINQIASSIKEFGFTNPVLIDAQGGVIAGHGRIMGAKKLNLTEVPTIVLSNLTEAQKKAYIIADNKIALNAGWDEDLLQLELMALDELGFDYSDLGFDFDIDIEELDDEEIESSLKEYSSKVEAPTYEPTGEKPFVSNLYDISKTNTMMEKIEASSIDKEIKEFLIIAAQRHTVLNFREIANYYSQSDKEVQELMEESALVIIDFNKAIENGYVKLTKEADRIREEEYGEDDEE